MRTKSFALSAMRLTRKLPNNSEGWVIGKQLLRSATSVAANYRAAGRGRSHAEFTAKIGIVVEETDETVFWLELLEAAQLVDSGTLRPLLIEANELLRIFSASYQTASASTRTAEATN
jgi:four helix bundle protein